MHASIDIPNHPWFLYLPHYFCIFNRAGDGIDVRVSCIALHWRGKQCRYVCGKKNWLVSEITHMCGNHKHMRTGVTFQWCPAQGKRQPKRRLRLAWEVAMLKAPASTCGRQDTVCQYAWNWFRNRSSSRHDISCFPKEAGRSLREKNRGLNMSTWIASNGIQPRKNPRSPSCCHIILPTLGGVIKKGRCNIIR